MNLIPEVVIRTLLIGIGATVVMDVWAVVAQRCFGISTSDWAMVGRWIGHFPQGRFKHESIAKASPVVGELAIGWVVHYLTGIAYAALLITICGVEWARVPTLMPAVLVGVSMLVAPFFIMQPCMGAGLMGSKTARPNSSRLRSVMNHVVFGIGLYATACVVAILPFHPLSLSS